MYLLNYFGSSEHYTVWLLGEPGGLLAPGNTGICIERSPLVNNLTVCRITNSKLFENGPIILHKLMGGSIFFSSKSNADVLFLFLILCYSTQTAKNFRPNYFLKRGFFSFYGVAITFFLNSVKASLFCVALLMFPLVLYQKLFKRCSCHTFGWG